MTPFLERESRIPPNPWKLQEFGVLLLWTVFVYSQIFLIISLMLKLHLLWSDAGHGIALLISGGGVYFFFLALVGQSLRKKNLTWDSVFGLENGLPVKMFCGAVLGFFLAIFPIRLAGGITHSIYLRLHQPMSPQPIFELLNHLLIPNPAPHGLAKTFWAWVNHLPNSWVLGGLVSLAVVLAPITEEMLFRGMLYPCLKERVGRARAILMTSFFFSATHFHLPSFLPLFILAITLNLLYEWRGNLLACIFCHALFNGASLYLWFITGR